MYAGRTVEWGTTAAVFETPAHPYTVGLLHAAAADRDSEGRFVTIPGDPPSISVADAGCPFAPRCAHAMSECGRSMPGPVTLSSGGGQAVRCWLHRTGIVPADARPRGRAMTAPLLEMRRRQQDLQALAHRAGPRRARRQPQRRGGRDRRAGRRKRIGKVDAGAHRARIAAARQRTRPGRGPIAVRPARRRIAPRARQDAAGLPGRRSRSQSAPHGARAPAAGVGRARCAPPSFALSSFSTASACGPAPNTCLAFRMSCPAASGNA